MIVVYGAHCKQWRELKKRQWFGMAVGALLYSAVAQGLTYVALQQTTVINVSHHLRSSRLRAARVIDVPIGACHRGGR